MCGGVSWPGVDSRRRCVPVRTRAAEEAGRGDVHGLRMRRHEVHLLRVRVVRAHVGQIRRVLVHGRVGRVRLKGLRDPVEVELVRVAFAVNFGHDVLVVVVAQGSTQLVVVHVGFALPLTPAPRHLVWVGHLELAVGSFPRDAGRVGAVGQKLQEELPQLDLTRA